MYGIFGRNFIRCTVIYGVDIRFWPTLDHNVAVACHLCQV